MKAIKTIGIITLAISMAAAAACGQQAASANTTAAASAAATISGKTSAASTAAALTDPVSESSEVTGDFSVTPGEGASAVTVSGSTYTITAAGEYIVTGSLEEGQIIVDAGDEDEVVILLNGASITSSASAPIYAANAGEVTVRSEEGSYNVINDERTGIVPEDSEDNAAIYADCDLKITGHGTLIVNASYDNGIKSKDDLKIKNVTLKVTAPGIALKGNDSVTVESGSLMIISTGADGIKTSNSDVSSKGNQRGVITISGGQTDIYAAGDGISAAYSAVIETGEEGTAPVVNIFTGSVSEYTKVSGSSVKGIKAENYIMITDGTVTVDSEDDALHANGGEALENGETSVGNIEISGGSITVSCGDDGIHADGSLTISGGSVNVAESHEGLEANVINITGGSTYVYGKDDGINANSGTSAPLVNITGGYLEVVTPQGDTDAIDSNGNITMSGGLVIVKAGAQMGGMAGSVDADGQVTVTGGTIIAFGGIASTPSGNSVNTYISSGTSFQSGSYVLKDGNGNEIASFALDGNYSSVWIASDMIELNGTYALTRDGSEVLSWTQSSAATGSAGSMGGFGGNMGGAPGMGGFGGQQGGPGGMGGHK